MALKSQNSESARLRGATTSGEASAPRAFWIWTTSCVGGGGQREDGVVASVLRHGRLPSRMMLSPSSLKIWFAVVARIGSYRCNSRTKCVCGGGGGPPGSIWGGL